jgi:hypothetical protein
MAYKPTKPGGRMVSVTQSLPPPVGGWNARDAVANMDPNDAVIMKNWFPMSSDIMVRKGWTTHSDDFSAQVETIMAYNSGSSSKMFGVSDGTIYNADSSTASAVVTSQQNSRFQYVNFTPASGTPYIVACNGSDDVWNYDGSSWTHPAIVGFSASNAIGVNVFKSRLWFVETGTLKAWYLNANSIAGTANAVDLTSFTTRGGYLVAMGTWTLDAGEGVDDYAVFVTSQGEVIVFAGTDPSSSSTWAMKGRWQIGAPIGRRCFLKYAGDLLLICVDGVVPMSKALISSRVQPRVALTDKIRGAMSDAATNYGSNFGWELLYCPKAELLLLNVPIQAGSDQQQYAMNTETGNWGQFLDISANCWEIFNDDPYFGGNGYIGKFWDTFTDNDGVDNIQTEALQAFNYFGKRGRLKHFKEARPIFASNGVPSVTAQMEVDYSTSNTVGTLSFTAVSYATWDSGVWDTAVWGNSLGILKNWQTLGAIGTAAAVHIFTASMGIEVRWQATDYLFEQGGVIG